ncbi:hypothetical protein SDC9_87087 [bioreactor metagenome]|uniref:Uncharacterized protein n=1 Tax=bioreactor metagenome TaxID=1076179 RepID=A0A644ZHW5_9ZZZZ
MIRTVRHLSALGQLPKQLGRSGLYHRTALAADGGSRRESGPAIAACAVVFG